MSATDTTTEAQPDTPESTPPDPGGTGADTPRPEPAPQGEAPAPSLRVLGVWLTEAVRRRLLETGGIEILEDRDRLGETSAVLVGTRLPRGQSLSLVSGLISEAPVPVLVICHAGGEEVAVSAMRAGATGVVAEGNEEALVRALREEPTGEGLVERFAGRSDRTWAGGGHRRSRDPLTGLLGASGYELEMAELEQAGAVPHLLLARVLSLDELRRSVGQSAVDLLRRRLAAVFGELAREAGADVYSLDQATFALLHRSWDETSARQVAAEMTELVASFATMGSPLALAVGIAGPDSAPSAAVVRDLGERALETAAAEGGGVVDAEDLTRSLASATELRAALLVADAVDEAAGTPEHSARVSEYARDLGQELGLDGWTVARIEVAGRFHDVGKSGLPPDSLLETGGASGEEYRSHPERSARYVEVSCGREVASFVRHHHERWDGSGFPDGLAGEEIPIGAQVIAVADAFDRWSNPADGTPPSTAEVVSRLEEASGSAFAPRVVAAAIALFRQAPG